MPWPGGRGGLDLPPRRLDGGRAPPPPGKSPPPSAPLVEAEAYAAASQLSATQPAPVRRCGARGLCSLIAPRALGPAASTVAARPCTMHEALFYYSSNSDRITIYFR